MVKQEIPEEYGILVPSKQIVEINLCSINHWNNIPLDLVCRWFQSRNISPEAEELLISPILNQKSFFIV